MTTPDSRETVRAWLLAYAWMNHTDEQKAAEVDCILAQDDWRHISALADKFAGAQEEPGPAAFSEGTQFALSALYECHDAPHTRTCPLRRPELEESLRDRAARELAAEFGTDISEWLV